MLGETYTATKRDRKPSRFLEQISSLGPRPASGSARPVAARTNALGRITPARHAGEPESVANQTDIGSQVSTMTPSTFSTSQRLADAISRALIAIAKLLASGRRRAEHIRGGDGAGKPRPESATSDANKTLSPANSSETQGNKASREYHSAKRGSRQFLP